MATGEGDDTKKKAKTFLWNTTIILDNANKM